LTSVVFCAAAVGLAQTTAKKKGEEQKFENQKGVMTEMGACFREMQALSDKLDKEKLGTSKLRKDLGTQAGRMAKLSEAWKPFAKPEKAKLADDLIAASNDLTKAAKPMGKKAQIPGAVMAVRMVCAECHKGYKPKEPSDADKGAKTK